MSNLFIEVSQTNNDKNYHVNDLEFLETKYSNSGELYRSLEKEYGRCISKMLMTDSNGKTRQIGWVFAKREYYSDCGIGKPIKHLKPKDRALLTFMCATWVSVHTAVPDKTIKYHFAKF